MDKFITPYICVNLKNKVTFYKDMHFEGYIHICICVCVCVYMYVCHFGVHAHCKENNGSEN